MPSKSISAALSAVLLGLAFAATPAAAQSAPPTMSTWDRDVFFFAGSFEREWFPDGLFPLEVLWTPNFFEDNHIIGGGYQQFFGEAYGFRFGLEAGLAGRFGDNNSVEAWAGGVIRSPGFDIGRLHVTPAITGGLSAATGTIGVETGRAQQLDRSVPLLFYMGPEIDFSDANQPNWEVFWRLQHRSGGYGIIAPIDGSNADTIGLRYKF